MKIRCLWLFLFLLLFLPLLAGAEVSYDDKFYDESAEYIDLGDHVVVDFDAFKAFLDQMPQLKRVDMWQNKMTASQCDMLAARYPNIRWGWTMVIKNRDHEHLVRTDYTSWSTLHNNQSAKHKSEDFAVLKYCWNLMALDIGHNNVTSLDFLYDLPNLRILIVACNAVTDITPVGSLEHLEYAELFNNKITDISPLSGLRHLLDLNLCFNKITDLSPVENLTTLKRLWLYSCQRTNTEPTGDQITAIRAALPDTQIDTRHYSTAGDWRYLSGNQMHPHYAVIVQNFGSNHLHPATEYVPFDDSWPLEETEEPTPELFVPEEEPRLQLLEPQDFSDKGYLLPIDFSAGSVPKESGFSELGYSDSTIKVAIHEGNAATCKYWYADIVLTDASQLRTMAAGLTGAFDSYSEMDGILLSDSTDAVVAINGDFWNSAEKRGLGYIIRQGILYKDNLDTPGRRDSRMMDVLLIDEDGDFIGLRQPAAGTIPMTINGKRILNSFSFGPILVEDGKAVDDYQGADRWLDMSRDNQRQRMCICQVDHLHYMVICCAGPYQGNTGMTLPEFSEVAASLGVRIAYNLDGGDSTLLYFDGDRINKFGSTSQRKLMDIIYFASAE